MAKGNDDATNGAKQLLGWLVTLVILAAITRTRTGYTIVYYALWLGIVLILLGSSDRVVSLLAAVRAPGPTGPAGEIPG
jgi:hypothetical protein